MYSAKLMAAGLLAVATLVPSLADAQLNAVGEGRRAWLKYNCYGCHGNNGAGGMGPNIQHTGKSDVNEALRGGAREGGMRSFAGIVSATEAANIAAYLGSIGTASEPTWLDWWNPKP